MRSKFLDGLAFGLLLGFIISTGSLWLIDSTRGVVREFFNVHLTHFVTLIAAGIALWGVSRQIQSNFDLAEKQRKAKLDAARSSLPIVLSNIHRMCEARCDAVSFGNKARPEHGPWEITDFELSALRSCIEHADGIEKELMQQIVRVYQILIARWRGLEVTNLFTADVLSQDDHRFIVRLEQFYAMRDWITLMAIGDSLFSYSRGEESNPDREKMKQSVFSNLSFINCSGSDGDGGWLLSGNSNYSDFLERERQLNNIAFIDGNWS